MSLSFQIYRILVPKPIRTMLLLRKLRNSIPAHYQSISSESYTKEQQEAVDFVVNNGVKIFPYHFTDKYNTDSIEVFTDSSVGLKYVLQDGKKLYFKRRWSEARIKKSFHDLSLEQDLQSPHRYLTDIFNLNENDVLADFGAAEGNFSLAVIEKVKKIYLFESDNEWIEALQNTFAPWIDKVEIVPKFVSDKNDQKNCSGDVFFKDREISFMKIDVDGGERPLLKGFSQLIRDRKQMKIALCTYHQHDDESEFTALLTKNGFNVHPSNGYMIFYYDKKLKAPYLRRALIRAEKK